MDEQQKATGKGPPDVTDDVASWLEAERAPAFAITPLSATLLAANAEDCLGSKTQIPAQFHSTVQCPRLWTCGAS